MLDDLLLQMIEKRNHRFFSAVNEYILKKKQHNLRPEDECKRMTGLSLSEITYKKSRKCQTALLEVYKHARFLYVFANRLAFST